MDLLKSQMTGRAPDVLHFQMDLVREYQFPIYTGSPFDVLRLFMAEPAIVGEQIFMTASALIMRASEVVR